MKCEHDIVDKDVACNCDGMCPLCLAVENKQLRQKIKELVDGLKKLKADVDNGLFNS